MNRDEDTILTEAAEWHAMSDSDAMDWEGFTAWLEADPRHRKAYDEIALGDALLSDRASDLNARFAAETGAEQVSMPGRRVTWKRWAGVAIAATLAAILIVPNYIRTPEAVYETESVSQDIALGDGSNVILAPYSRLSVEGRNRDRVALSGGAWFDIVHDPDRPLIISANGLHIRDIGTQFDVQSDKDQVRIEVADGKVEVSSPTLSTPVELSAGKALHFDGAAGLARVSPIDLNDAGEWRSGRLSYETAPLSLVATDLARYADVKVMVPNSLGNRRFSGTLVISDGEAAVRDLSQVMELSLDSDAGGYRLSERNR